MSYPIQKAGSASDVTANNKAKAEYGNILAQQLAVEAGLQTRVTYSSGGSGASSTLLSASRGNTIFTIAELRTVVANIISNTATNSAQATALASAANRKLGITANISNNIPVVAWSPLLISGIRAWFDSSDPNATGSAPVNNTSLSVWKDKANNVSATVASGTLTYNSSGGLNFSSTYLNLPNGTLPYGNNPFYYFFVINPSSSSAMYVAGIGSSNVGGQCGAIQLRGSDIDFFAGDLTSTPCPPANTLSLVMISYKASNHTRSLVYNISTTATDSSLSTLTYPSGPQQIGAFNSNTSYFSGKMYDFIAFSTELSSSDKQKVEGYLAWKWGLQIATSDFNPVIKLLLDTDTNNTGTASATRPATNNGSVTVGVNSGQLSASFTSGKFISVPFLDITQAPFSISYWFNTPGGDYDPWTLSLNNDWVINPDINGGQNFYIKLGGVFTVGPGFSFSAGWNHVTLTIDNTATTLGVAKSYLNGVSKGTVIATTVGTLPNAQYLYVGKSDSRAYVGSIRQFMVHDFVLSQAQITSLYTQTQNILPSTHLYSSMAPSS
jgi:hypothetical protein